MKENIKDLYEEYYSEMMAEGAWSGHAYAAEYLADLRAKLINLFNTIKSQYEYKNGYLYKNGQMNISSTEESIFKSACRGAWYLSDDFNALINRVYANEAFTSDDKTTIADALDKAFKNKLVDTIEVLEDIAKNMSIDIGQEE